MPSDPDSLNAVAELTTVLAEASPSLSGDWMITTLYGILLAWLVVVVVFLVRLIRRYTFFDPQQWSRETHPFIHETMALPRGVFRSLITVSLLIVVLLMEIISLANGGLENRIEQLLTAFQMMLAFYFGSKVMDQVSRVDARKVKARQKTEEAWLAAASGARRGPVTTDEFEVEGAKG